MQGRIFTAGVLAAMLSVGTAEAAAVSRGLYVVTGVEEGDMLKLRAGPGTGYVVIVGLPNGSEIRVHDCQRVGGTRWCEVSLESVRELRGYVADSYLRKK